MYMRIQERRGKGGETRYYASVMRTDRVGGKVVQTTVAYIGRVEEDQVPYLKAAYTEKAKRPRLVWDDPGAEEGK
jgi:hypothetical protein